MTPKEMKIIADFLGYTYSEKKILVDEGDYDYTAYQERTVFAKVPILLDDNRIFDEIPNPDYQTGQVPDGEVI